ncbi:hypothetical protein ACU42Y_11755 [Proteus mirabilis]
MCLRPAIVRQWLYTMMADADHLPAIIHRLMGDAGSGEDFAGHQCETVCCRLPHFAAVT